MNRKEKTKQSQQQQQHYNPGSGPFIHNPIKPFLEPSWASLSKCRYRLRNAPVELRDVRHIEITFLQSLHFTILLCYAGCLKIHDNRPCMMTDMKRCQC